MATTAIKVSPSSWKTILVNFNELVNNGDYNKIDYHFWKVVYKDWTKENEVNEIEIIPCFEERMVRLRAFYKDGTQGTLIFTDNDFSSKEGLYKYIYDHWIYCKDFQLIETVPITATKDMIDQICNDLSSSFRISDNTLYITKEQAEQLYSFPENADVRLMSIDTATNINDKIDDLTIAVEKLKNKINNNKENNTMKNFNFDFGPCTKDNVRMSMYGLAVKNAAGTYVSYNANTNEIVDVDILNFDGGKYLYKMPTAVKDITTGDVIIHMHKPMFVCLSG